MYAGRMNRLLRLITLLQATGPNHIRELCKTLGVSRRTLFRDLEVLRGSGIPVVTEGPQRGLRIDRSFFLPPINFTLAEALALLLMLDKLGAAADPPDSEAVKAALLKIGSILPAEVHDHCIGAISSVEVRPGPRGEKRGATSLFDTLWEACRNREMVDIAYDSLSNGAVARSRVRPYRLAFLSRYWYLLAFSQIHHEMRTFRLDRIRQARLTGKPFIPPREFDAGAYFGNAWQLVRGPKRYQVRIRFSPRTARNVEEGLWHPTQSMRRLKDGSLRFQVQLDGIEEIAWWVLGFGREAFVESPPELQEIIETHIRALARTYRVALGRTD